MALATRRALRFLASALVAPCCPPLSGCRGVIDRHAAIGVVPVRESVKQSAFVACQAHGQLGRARFRWQATCRNCPGAPLAGHLPKRSSVSLRKTADRDEKSCQLHENGPTTSGKRRLPGNQLTYTLGWPIGGHARAPTPRTTRLAGGASGAQIVFNIRALIPGDALRRLRPSRFWAAKKIDGSLRTCGF